MSTPPPAVIASLAGLFGIAIGAAFPDRRPTENRQPEPIIEHVRGHVTDHPPRELRPLTIRTAEAVRIVGSPSTVEAPTIATVYLDVNGSPVVLSLEVGP